jgi:hypothetical protein
MGRAVILAESQPALKVSFNRPRPSLTRPGCHGGYNKFVFDKNSRLIRTLFCTSQTEMRWCCTKDTWAWEEMALVCGASVISGGITGVGARYKQNNPRVMMNHCACHKSSLSAADAAGVPELAVFDHQVKSFYNFFGHYVDRRIMHSHVQQRMQEIVRHLKKGIVTVSAGGPIFCIRQRPDFSMTVSAGGPIFLFCCFIEVTMTVVKSVSDGLRDSETQLNLNRSLRISPGPRHLSRPLAI